MLDQGVPIMTLRIDAFHRALATSAALLFTAALLAMSTPIVPIA
jgi:hypothetical protein